jgi:hypothetical protein
MRDDAAAAITDDVPELDRWQAAKGLLVAVALFGAFLFTPWPRRDRGARRRRDALTSDAFTTACRIRRPAAARPVRGIFVVNDAFRRTGLPA